MNHTIEVNLFLHSHCMRLNNLKLMFKFRWLKLGVINPTLETVNRSLSYSSLLLPSEKRLDVFLIVDAIKFLQTNTKQSDMRIIYKYLWRIEKKKEAMFFIPWKILMAFIWRRKICYWLLAIYTNRGRHFIFHWYCLVDWITYKI